MSGGAITVENVGTSTTATDLGIAGTAGAGQNLYGQGVNYVTVNTLLSTLNDGVGVRINPGLNVTDFRIQLKNGTTYDIDISESDTTLQHVVDKINNAGPGIQAAVNQAGNGLILTDTTGLNTNPFTVTALNSSNAAWDLGIFGASAELAATGVEDAANGTIIVGRRLIGGLNSILTRTVNGGTSLYNETVTDDFTGVRNGTIQIRDRAGQTVALRLDSKVASTLIGNVVQGATSITVANGSGFHVGNRLRLTGGGVSEFKTIKSVTDNGTNYTVTFAEAVNNAAGYTAGNAVYASNESLADVIRAINNNGLAGVTAGFNTAKNALRIVDTTGAAATSLDISAIGGNAGADLHILGNAGSSNALDGGDLNPVYVHSNTKLASMNGGAGVFAGRFRVTDRNNVSFTVDISQTSDDLIGDVIRDFNGAAVMAGSTARIRVNDAGNGLIVVDSGLGTGTLSISELDGGSSAKDLNIKGTAPTATPNTLDGSFEYVFNISATDTLTTLMNSINSRKIGVGATIVSDGSATAPYRLSLASQRSGSAGRMTVSATLPGMTFQSAMAAQDAVVLYGSGEGGATPFAVTSSDNTITEIIAGMTLQLKQAVAAPVTVTVSRDMDAIVNQVKKLVDGYNEVVANINQNSTFDSKTFAKGILFGDSAVLSIQRTLRDSIVRTVPGIPAGQWNTFSAMGVKMTTVDKVTFDESKLRSALDSDPDAVGTLFTKQRVMTLDTKLTEMNDGRGVENRYGDDFRITRRDGVTMDVDIQGDTIVADILHSINSHPNNSDHKLAASLSSNGMSIILTDTSSQVGDNVLSVVALNNCRAAQDLGIATTTSLSESTLTGNPINLRHDVGLAAWIVDKISAIAVDDTGLLTSRTRGLDDRIESLNKQIEKNEERVKRVEKSLVREFTNLEKILSQSQTIMQQLSQLSNTISGFRTALTSSTRRS
jgi:flagellar capping protein FliD